MGMAPRHVPGRHYPGMSLPFQPLVRPCLPTGRCAPGSGVEAHGCEHRCLQDGLGCRLKRADSFGLLVRTSTAVAHQLPRVARSASSTVSVSSDAARQACADSNRQCSDGSVYQPAGWFALPSHVATRPPSQTQSESDAAQIALLAHPDLVCRPHAPRDSPSLEDSPEEGPSFSGDGHNLAPASRSLEPPCVASGRDSADLTGHPQAVIDTITQARAPSTRQAYALKWGLFADWCSSHRENPHRCSVAVTLSFLQDKLERRLSPSTLKVYVAAINAYHDAVDGLSLGKHHLIVRFLRGARRLNPPRSHLIPSWDLSVVLLGLWRAPFEPLASVELKYLSLKTLLLIALTSIKRVGTCTLSPSASRASSSVRLILTDQVVSLQALPLEEADPALSLLCPVRALRTYVDRTRSFRHSEQLFVCFGGQQMGNAVSKQRLAHWVVDAITLAYQCQGNIRLFAGGRLGVGLLRHSYWIRALFPVVPLGELWILLAPSVQIRTEFLDCVRVSAPQRLLQSPGTPGRPGLLAFRALGRLRVETHLC
ncbi:hypothetical protein H4Q32_018039 [Labeo rohita]|uniref:Core-binding (CB) domain-containing protein n=1 Tax=Labeo rohita TaxID=84645 RepID=A0ABQ8LY88_LABRO|nr:hypothetical protein H4Q32_018039 [Labeo rohita]